MAPIRPPAPARRATLAAFLFVLAHAVVVPAGLVAQEGIAVGALPEPPVLETLDGEAFDLGGLVGRRPVLLEFWATWCTVCRALEPALTAAHEAYGDRVEFVIVAAAVAQDQDRVRAHLARHPLPGRILWDARGRATRAFEAPGTGYIVLLDGEGRVAYTGMGAGQDLVAAVGRVVTGARR